MKNKNHKKYNRGGFKGFDGGIFRLINWFHVILVGTTGMIKKYIYCMMTTKKTDKQKRFQLIHKKVPSIFQWFLLLSTSVHQCCSNDLAKK